MEELVKGLGASAGKATGRAMVLSNIADNHVVTPGAIIVAKYTSPTLTPHLIGAKAIITDVGGILSHAAVIARELGIPAVVGTKEATAKIKDGDNIMVDGDSGKVFYAEE